MGAIISGFFAILNSNKENNSDEVFGVVLEALPNTLFRVELSDKSVTLANLSGKMRIHRIRVLIGDKVTLKLDPYGGRARIIKRTK